MNVEEFDDIKSGYRIGFIFFKNLYFSNDIIFKEFYFVNIGNIIFLISFEILF